MKLSDDFFSFDFKDTLRLVVWVAISGFAIGGLYAQRQADQTRVSALEERVHHIEGAVEQTIANQRAILIAMKGVEVELRTLNDQVKELRSDAKERLSDRANGR